VETTTMRRSERTIIDGAYRNAHIRVLRFGTSACLVLVALKPRRLISHSCRKYSGRPSGNH
jgi:hypothetical protein